MKDFPATIHEDLVVVHLEDPIEQDAWLGFRDHMHRTYVERGVLHLVLDCEGCPELPSLAFGAFSSLSRDLRRLGGSLQLVHVSERIRHVLTRTRMDAHLPIRGTITELIRGGAKPSGGARVGN